MTQSGILKRIGKEKQVTATFKNRTFDIETVGDKYPQTLRFELSQDNCDIVDAYAVGQEIDISYNLRGREWQKTPEDDIVVFNTIVAWKIQPVGNLTPNTAETKTNTQEFGAALPGEQSNDLPF